ncbi:NADPH:quinone oxidoreductase [Arachis duranensis]|uniref:NAD(P)H dehydrogenase (quinone) n=1 Tax=Arachis duranensis TaxID=130453 RepID=A0A6P4CAD4_ARADU|nr:NADPH:quinone oxidoreductase [Arachis duranensis]
MHSIIGGRSAMSEEKAMIKVAALCGSLRKASFNRGLLRAAIELSQEQITGLHVEFIDTSSLPMLNTDLEQNGRFPPEVEEFRQKILEADCCFFASPDYNYSVTPLLKNALDWGSRPPNVWAGKAAAVVTAGGGGGRAQYHLRQIGVFLDLHFINKPEFYLNAFQPPVKFNDDGDLIDSSARERLKDVLLSLQDLTLRLQGNKS